MTGRLRGADIREQSRNDLENAYFNWITDMVCSARHECRRYRRLLRLLHETAFRAVLMMDENRASDGIELRFQFALESGLEASFVEDALNGPCSVLEMMAALAQRCEVHITDDPEVGNRMGKWFFGMLKSLGLSGMDDAHFDKIRAADILERFLKRDYAPDGRGGLFTVSPGGRDMRRVEIWYQMMRYLSESVYAQSGIA